MSHLKRFLLIVLALALVIPSAMAQTPQGAPVYDPVTGVITAYVLFEWPDGSFQPTPYDGRPINPRYVTDAEVLYEHSDGRYYAFPEDTRFGPGVYVYQVSLEMEEQNPDAELYRRNRVRQEINWLEGEAYYLNRAVRDGTPHAVFMSDIMSQNPLPSDLPHEIYDEYIFHRIRQGRDDYTYFQEYNEYLRSRAQILGAELDTIGPAIDASLRLRLHSAESGMQITARYLGDIVNDMGFGPGGTFFPVVFGIHELLGTAALMANQDLELVPGQATIGDVIDARRDQLMDNKEAASDLWHTFLQMITGNSLQDNNTTDPHPCYPVVWYEILGGWEFVDRIDDLAFDAAKHVWTENLLNGTIAEIANDQLGNINAQTKGYADAIAGTINQNFIGVINESGRTCVEGWQDFPNIDLSTYYNYNYQDRS